MKLSLKLCSVLLVAVLAGCGGAPDTAPSSSSSVEQAADAIEIAVIPKGLSLQFWLSVKAGAEAAASEAGATVIWQGPTKETEVTKQIDIVQDLINRGVDALVLAACDENALVATVEQAAAKMPVITIDSGVVSDTPLSLVATDNVAGAREAAKTLAKFIGEAGPVGLIPFVPGAATSQMRVQGFKEGIAAYSNIKLVAEQPSMSDVAKAMDVTQDMLTTHPDLKGIFATNEPSAIGAAQAIKAAGKAGEVKIVSFDASEEQINALKEGAIQALIVQNPYKMGYMGVQAALDALAKKPVEKRIDTGVTIVTQENLNQPEVQKLLHPTAS